MCERFFTLPQHTVHTDYEFLKNDRHRSETAWRVSPLFKIFIAAKYLATSLLQASRRDVMYHQDRSVDDRHAAKQHGSLTT
jgi:hypothetical protein